MEITESEFGNELLAYDKLLFLCHRAADPDAIASSFALAEAFGGTIGIIDGCNRIASLLIDQLGIKVVHNPNPKDFDMTIVVDTSTSAQLNNFPLENYCVIDHHVTSTLNEKAAFYVHRNTGSTAEIVLEVLRSVGAPILERVAFALMAGIITDTGNFKHAQAGSFRAIAELIDLSGIEYGEVIDLLASTPQDISMRIALLKAAQRAAMERLNDWVVVSSQVSSFSGSAASMLVSIGADVAFVGSKREDIVKISCRARRCAIEAGINLAKAMEELSAAHNGTGGGHEGAAGMDVRGDLEEILASCRDYAERILGKG